MNKTILEFGFILSNEALMALDTVMEDHSWTGYRVDETAITLTVEFINETATMLTLYGIENIRGEMTVEFYRNLANWYETNLEKYFENDVNLYACLLIIKGEDAVAFELKGGLDYLRSMCS